jgi:uncharacterized protein (DUF2235 family)
MSKNVILCVDGTWNGPGSGEDSDDTPDATNVLKLFENLDGEEAETVRGPQKERALVLPGPDGGVRQVAFYLHGIGDSENPLKWLLGGFFGAGLVARIVRGYIFLSLNVAAGDRIFIAGFSRGAYIARALAGLVAAKGLINPAKADLKDRPLAFALGAAAWFAHRRDQFHGTGKPVMFERILYGLNRIFVRPPVADDLVPVPIEAVAVWETVGALGIPEYTKQKLRIDAFRFADLRLSPKVKRGLHAIAIDEMREDLTPTLWEPDDRITQHLFAGSHGDVGGGFPQSDGESGLSDGALLWMMDELAQLGVHFSAPPTHAARPDAAGVAHRPWLHLPWSVMRHGTPRRFPDNGLGLSPAARERMAAGKVPVEGEAPRLYAPSNLPPSLR